MSVQRPFSTFPDDRYGTARRSAGSVPLLVAATLPLLICGGLLVYGSGRGLDLTDEIFYLVWAGDPNAHALLYQPFGYLLHPLFELVARDLQAYRLAGFAAAAAAGAFLGCSLPSATGNRPAFAVYGASVAFTIFFPWIITPSYNSVANVGALLVIGGILYAQTSSPAGFVIGALGVAGGLCLAAFSKPPLFAIAVLLILIVALISRKVSARIALMLSLAVAAILISLFVPLTELPALVWRMITSQHVLALPNTPLALPAKVVRDWAKVPAALTGAAVAILLSFALRWSRWFKGPAYAAAALGLYYLASVTGDAIDRSIPDFIGLAFLTLAAAYAALLQHERHASVLAIALLLGAPVAVALGTFNNQWFQLNFSLVFPFIAIFALAPADPVPWRRGVAQGLAVIGPIAVMLLAASAPYSLPASIFEQQTRIEPPLARGSILVDDETAAFVDEGRGLARGALLVDLSGTGPGVAAVLEARAPVLPWLNPATPTWPDVVWQRLSGEQRREAWFIGPVAPQFGRSAPARWLEANRARFCGTALPEMPFWGEERTLEVLRPCARGEEAAENAAPDVDQ